MLHNTENEGVVPPASTATTGVAELDQALNGLYWGDNVVFDAEHADEVEPFYRAVAAEAALYEGSAFVTLVREPTELERTFPGFEIIDAREGSPLQQPRPLLDAIARRYAGSPRQLLLFDSLGAMSDRWGRETAGRFFTRGCPLLLGLGAIAYWSLTAARQTPTLRREVEGVTQLVLDVGDGRLRIVKAEGRRPGVEGSVFRYHLEDGLPVLEAAPAAARLGAALRSLRIARHLSQGIWRASPVSHRAPSPRRSEGGVASRSRRFSIWPASSTSRSTSSCAGTLHRATVSPAATIRATRRPTRPSRCSTIPARACGRTSCDFHPEGPRRPGSPTRESSS